ncbi:MAG TPA: ATP-binding protein [Bacteroidales bacterium]|nr:ATP-binding protein [Bacteroidales bacterium]
MEREVLKPAEDIINLLNEAQHIAKIGSWDWNVATGDMWWSDELYTIFEVDPAEYTPTFESSLKFIHPEDAGEFQKAAVHSMNTGEMLDYRFRIVTSKGIKDCHSKAKVYLNEKGEAQRMTGTSMDVTEMVTIVEELNSAKDKAEESDRLKTAFLQNISHEVRTPLNSIVGFSELITEPGQSLQKIKSFSKIISANSNRLISIISDVIEIAEIHSGQVRLVISKFDLISLFSRSADAFRELCQLKGIELLVNNSVDEDESIIVSDKGKLEKIFLHLIDNAVKFTQRGSVRIDLSVEKNILSFDISDTGIGIDEREQSIIFDPFRQLETGLSRSYGGTGLGLTIVKAYVEALKGTISLTSELNRGTSVKITLPVIVDRVSIPEAPESNVLNDHVNTILIAEDEYSNFKYLYELLQSDKTRIIHAKNGKEALDICKSSDVVDMVLMDLKMPVMDGTAAATLIKQLRPELPIIAQTAYIPDEDKLNSVFDDLIAKPINRNELKDKINKYISVPI